MVKGIFLSRSSFIAISRGSVSPSSCTITGAFMEICSARVPNTRARSYLPQPKQGREGEGSGRSEG